MAPKLCEDKVQHCPGSAASLGVLDPWSEALSDKSVLEPGQAWLFSSGAGENCRILPVSQNNSNPTMFPWEVWMQIGGCGPSSCL